MYADSDGIIEMQENTMLRFCLANVDGGGGIKSGGNVSHSGGAVVSGCTALVAGGMAVASARAVVDIRDAAEIVSCTAVVGGVHHLLDTRLLIPHTQVR